MRIAVTGTHGVGKSTLIDDFVEAHPGYVREDEPYWALAQNGIAFTDGASLPDLEEQLEASIGLILSRSGDPDVIFDRCPIDMIAYLEVVAARQREEWEPSGRQLARIEKALAALDVIAFVPLTQPDEIAVSIEFPRLRTAVDRRLKAILRDDALELLEAGPPRVVEVSGPRPVRLRLMSTAIGTREPS